jgi:hypothetical protein
MRLDTFRVDGCRLKIFLDWSFSFFIVRIYSFLDFVCLVGFGPMSGGNNKQIRWECQIDPLGQIEATKRLRRSGS